MAKKLFLASLMSLALMTATPAFAAETNLTKQTPFTDIAEHWAEKEITELYNNGVVKMNETETFRPNEPITRGEMLTLFLAANGIEPEPVKKMSFADVTPDNWLAPYAETAFRLGIIQGKVSGGKIVLQANDPVERQELVAILIRSMGDSGRVNNMRWSTSIQTLNAYPDNDEVDTWGQRNFAYALTNKLTKPIEGNLEPKKLMTRAEAASYAYKNLFEPRISQTKLKREKPFTFEYKRVMTVQTTAYYNSGGNKAYLGWNLREGMVAVDPKVIPLGTHLYIEGYGYAVAADIGSAVKSNHIDVFLPSLQACLAYGRQKDTKVYILD
ncbi:S-layer homology domain-containing protein [Brevibacillus dissolubilis]|uniref:S-layer homology domain-containing protein n=1 Tax=Brevibacillus dissolubilis TaxID=1844116 RepID=UPI0011171422|nr:S-layer homology domain-containing protein [Brevibacillus dissolubilis]